MLTNLSASRPQIFLVFFVTRKKSHGKVTVIVVMRIILRDLGKVGGGSGIRVLVESMGNPTLVSQPSQVSQCSYTPEN